jgi:tetratricopeptide (TPR) repeat protein
MLGQFEKSITSYQLALKLNPESAECYFNLASAQFDKGALDQAKMNFMLAQEINQDNPETHY